MFGKTSDPAGMKFESAETTKACVTCGCVVRVEKLKQVNFINSYSIGSLSYCGRCAPSYDERTTCFDGTMLYFRRVPEHLVEVTEDGEEIKPKPKKVK